MSLSLLKFVSPAAKLSIVYLVFSALWIVLSDEIVTGLHRSAETTERFQNAKGLTFVFLSGLLLYAVSKRLYIKLQNSLDEKSEALVKLTALRHATKEGIIDYNFSTDTAQINEQMQAFLGTNYLRVTNFEQLHRQRVHPEDRKRVSDQFYEFVDRKESLWQTEYRYRNSKGVYRHILSRGFIIRDEVTNQPTNLLLALQDVTEIRQANSKIHLQQLKHRQEITQRILEAQEIERNRWAEELHDNVCQVLTVAKLYLEQANGRPPQPDFQQKAQEMVEKAINDIRQISSLIKPPAFSETSLSEAINCLFSNLKRFHAAKYALMLSPNLENVLTEAHKILLYRVIQEGLNNTIKYAGATEVNVTIKLSNSMVEMRLKDNGKGFSTQLVNSGLGLQNIRSRLQAFAGQLSINSAPGAGCELHARFSI